MEKLNYGTPHWIDFDPAHQREARNAIASLALPGSVDELGIGVFRDVLSNLLFPGMTVTMTRAVYLALLPSFMYQVEKELVKEARKSIGQTDLVSLYYKKIDKKQKEFCKNNKDKAGIIGNSKDGEIKRPPWNIYWNALCLMDLIPPVYRYGQPVLSQRTYVRQVCEEIDSGRDKKWLDEQRWNGYSEIRNHKFTKPEIDLSETESVFIKNRINEKHKDSLLAKLIQPDSGLDGKKDFSELEWNDAWGKGEVKEVWEEAVFFNTFMKTAFAGYNLLLNFTKKADNAFKETLAVLKTKYPNADRGRSLLDKVFNRVFGYDKRKEYLQEWFKSCYQEPFNYSALKWIVKEEFLCKGSNAKCQPLYEREKEIFSSGNVPEEIRNIIPQAESPEWVGMEELDYRCYQSTRLLHHLITGNYEEEKGDDHAGE